MRTTRVLVAEDDDMLRSVLGAWLTRAGYDVRLAADGMEALDIARWETFDVAVTDLKMPNLDGLGLLDALQTTAPHVRVIFLSGEGTMDAAIAALRHGRAFDFLSKPLASLDELGEAIERALGSRGKDLPAPAPEVDATTSHPLMEAVYAFIDANIANPIGLADVARAVGYSPSHLTALVRQSKGQPVMQWVSAIRLERAQGLLRETDWAIARVAAAVGYADARYFARQFRKAMGDTPQNWRSANSRRAAADER